jgi:HEPN domain-containing protein
MSTEKNIREAIRWFTTAEDDNDSALILKENGKFAHSCFHAQQAGEKALKAVWYFADADPFITYSKKIIDEVRLILHF